MNRRKDMLHIEVIGLDPPCRKCTELLENVMEAKKRAGIEATVEKKWTLSREIWQKYGLQIGRAHV